MQEALELEEKMKTLDAESLNKSKLRICLEHGILDWAQYEKWYTSQIGVSSLKSSVTALEVEKFVQFVQAIEMDYAQYDFWSDDLIPLTLWDNQLIVLGLQYNEQLVMLGEPIFILAPPEVLYSIRRKIADQKTIKETKEQIEMSSEEEISDALEGLNFNQAAPKLSFTLIQPLSPTSAEPIANATQPPEAPLREEQAGPSIALVLEPTQTAAHLPSAAVAAAPVIPPSSKPIAEAPSVGPLQPSIFANAAGAEPTDGIWEFISERHQEYSFEIKKQFDAFVVLKINNKKTQVFKMDADMARQNVNQVIFEYSLEKEGPFKRIFESRRSDSFTLAQLDMYLYDYQHACITPLLRGDKVVGFFLGFKKNPLSQQDKTLLEELASETAS